MSEESEAAGTGESDGAGGGTLGWRSQLEGDLGNNDFVKTYDDSPEGLRKLVGDHVHGRELQRRKGVPMPAWDKPDDVDRFFKDLGRPDAYKRDHLEIPESAKASMEASQNTEPLVAMLHDAGLSQMQFDKVFGGYMKMLGTYSDGQATAGEDALKSGVAALKAKWGTAYDGNLELAQRALQTAREGASLGDVVLDQQLLAGGTLRTSPDLAEMFYALGSKMGEGSLLGGKMPQFANKTPEAAQEELDRFEKEHHVALFVDRTSPGRDALLRQRSALFAAINPE